MQNINLNQSNLLTKVHQLVIDIISNELRFDLIIDELNDLYHPFMYYYESDNGLIYSMPIEAFFRSTQYIVGDQYPEDVIWDYDKTQRLIKTLSYYKKDIKRERSVFSYQESKNKRTLEKYVRHLIHHYKRLLFVRIDLKYAKETSHLVSIEDFYHHMSKFRDLIGNEETCFEDLQGYAWALEHGGIEGGLHCHLLLIYDGNKRQNDWYIAKEVGEKWKVITGGLGECYNYHNKKTKQGYERNGKLGIGMIHQDNEQEVNNALRTSCYLTQPSKYDQKLKVWLPNMNTFAHGQYRTEKRRGLPPISK